MREVRRGVSHAEDPGQVAAELAAAVANPDAAAVLVFAAPRWNLNQLAERMAAAFAPVPVYGCTTAGEIGPDGFTTRSAVAMSLASDGLRVGAGLATGLGESAISAGLSATEAAAESLSLSFESLDRKRHVAVCLVDGRSGQEESFIAGAAGGARAIRFVGGSASDNHGELAEARIFFDGRAIDDAGLILLFESEDPFTVIMSEHMEPMGEPVVVTESDPAARLVHELNGKPARAVYEDIVGVRGDELTIAISGAHPFAYYIGGRAYVRSVFGVEGDSLRFASAVGNGIALRPMRAGDMLRTTRAALRAATDELGGNVAALIAFNCLGRFYETETTGMTKQIGDVLVEYPIIGFNTFGEQINALHVNHTLTALAFGGTHNV